MDEIWHLRNGIVLHITLCKMCGLKTAFGPVCPKCLRAERDEQAADYARIVKEDADAWLDDFAF